MLTRSNNIHNLVKKIPKLRAKFETKNLFGNIHNVNTRKKKRNLIRPKVKTSYGKYSSIVEKF